MSEDHLNTLMNQLLAIDDDAVHAPQIPMAIALQEANDLAVLLQDAQVAQQLTNVGVEASAITQLPVVVGAAREAQSRWMAIRDRSKDDAQKTREQDGAALRRELSAACRWNLRDSRTALGTLSAIAQGQGVADLVQDLNDLAELIDKHAASFASDKTFEPSPRAEAARSAASAVAAGLSGERLDMDQATAKRLRDRAVTLLDDSVATLREAGRYAFRDDAATAARFRSEFRRRRRRQRMGINAPEAGPISDDA